MGLVNSTIVINVCYMLSCLDQSQVHPLMSSETPLTSLFHFLHTPNLFVFKIETGSEE